VIGKGLDRGLGVFAFGAGALVAFESDRAEGGGNDNCTDCDHHKRNTDIFVYDALAQTVLALPGVDTTACETNPRLSANGQFLVYQTDANGTQDIEVLDLSTMLIDTLHTLNTTDFDEMEPDVSDDGNLIIYVSNEARLDDGSPCDQLRIYNTHNGADFIVPVADRGLNHITWPTISGNGDVIAYGAIADTPHVHQDPVKCDNCDPNTLPSGAKDRSDAQRSNYEVFLYSIRAAAQLTPPFINAPDSDTYNPDLNELGDKVVYVSNRRGSEDIYLTDLRSGFTDNMVLANSDCHEQEPRFLGLTDSRIVFQSDRTGNFRIYAYDLPTALLDLLPLANECCDGDSMLRDFHPHLPKFPTE
jgi:Tol biopolymer transport system component